MIQPSSAASSPVERVHGPWLDARGRRPLRAVDLAALVEHGVSGIVFTVRGFERGLEGPLTRSIDALAARGLRDPRVMYERVAVEEARAAADALEGVHDRTGARDGYAVLELSPAAGRDAGAAVEEARRLLRLVGRRNVMLQVPATAAGSTALAALVADGNAVSVTLVATPIAYEVVAGAHLRGVKRFVAAPRNGRLPTVIASVPVRRIDFEVGRAIDAALAVRPRPSSALRGRLARARGEIGEAIATLADARGRELAGSDEWRGLAELGIVPPRLIEDIGGSPSAANVDRAWTAIRALFGAGLSPADLGDRVLADEVAALDRSFESVLARVARVRDRAVARLRHARRHP